MRTILVALIFINLTCFNAKNNNNDTSEEFVPFAKAKSKQEVNLSQRETDLQQRNLKGRVKSVVKKTYADESKNAIDLNEGYWEYDKYGFETELIIDSPEKTRISTSTTYSDIGVKSKSIMESGSMIVTDKFFYDDNGFNTEVRESIDSGDLFITKKTIYEYDSKGNKIRGCYYKKNKLTYCIEMDYEDGERVEFRSLKNGVVDYRVREKSINGLLMEDKEYSYSSLVKTRLFKYNKNRD
jgi:hypothetical protein